MTDLKLAVLVHADVVGSTALMQANEILAHQRIQDAFTRFNEIIMTHGGIAHEIRGDALVAEFSRASDAVSASLEFQETNAKQIAQLSDNIHPVVRVGIAMGEVVIADNTISGEGIVLAQRLEQLADPGEVCIQDAAYQTIPKRFPYTFKYLGEHSLKGFHEPVRAFQARIRVEGETPQPAVLTNSVPVESEANNKLTIIVMPFTNIGGDSEQEYFSDGITDSIILHIGMFKGLTVKSRHSSFAYKNSGKSIQQIADELDIRFLVEGSVRKSEHKIRINAQLIECPSGNHLWGKRYDADLADIFELELALSQSIASTISGQIGQSIQRIANKKVTHDLRSYDYYMRGMYQFNLFTPETILLGKAQFEKCIEIDPDYADAHAGLAASYDIDVIENWTADRKSSLKLSNYHARKALELDSQSAMAHAFMAEQLFFVKDFQLGGFHADRAIELNPILPDGYSYKAWALGALGNFDEAEEVADQSMRLDPYHPYAGWIAGEVYRNIGKYDKAIKAFRSIPHIPGSVVAETAASFAGLGLIDEARAEMKRYQKLSRENMPVYPPTVEDWRQYWYEGMPYYYDKDSDRLFDLLLKAGLDEDLGSEH